jgi:hypothetical protein
MKSLHTHATRAQIIAVASALGVVALGSSAYAYWLTTGAGSGSGATANGLTAFTTTATVPSGALLYPGATAPLTVDVDNTGNNYALTVTAVSLDGSRSIQVDSAHQAACTNPAISVTTPNAWAGISVGQDTSSGAVTVPGAVSMGLTASSGCQGATFTIPVTLTGRN